MVDAGGVVIWLGSAREDLVRGTVIQVFTYDSEKPLHDLPHSLKFG